MSGARPQAMSYDQQEAMSYDQQEAMSYDQPQALIGLKEDIRSWGQALGFQQVGFTDTNLGEHEAHLQDWLAKSCHGDMHYMAAHGQKRSRPHALASFTASVISVRMNYLPAETRPAAILASDRTAYVARYSLGRDYHKLIRKRLLKLSQQIQGYLAAHNLSRYQARVFTDSAPVLEKALAQKAGLGWIGKNTLLLNRQAGSWFFLGEIFTNLPFEPDPPIVQNHCGSCTQCLDICPTKAFVGPYQLDARKCISYLTIEHKGAIDPSLRRGMGNRIFGCDDCQIFCPWSKFAENTAEQDFTPRHHLDSSALLSLFAWSEAEFLHRTLGSAIRRAGYQGWLRNIAIGLGNAGYDAEIVKQLNARKMLTSNPVSSMVIEHIDWALREQRWKQQRHSSK